jgi:hypothetical protein
MRRFLEYVVVETIEGRAGSLKEYSIGLEVFRKARHLRSQDRLDRAVGSFKTTD